MWKSCGRCGKIHNSGEPCTAPRIRRQITPDQRLRSTSRWQTKREEIKDRSQWLCAICKAEGVYTYDNIEVHHIIKLSEAPEKLLDDENLICLCKHHHEQADAGKFKIEYLQELAKARDNA